MNYSHEEHKRHAFDSFCKKVLKHEARDFYDEVKRQKEREIPFADLSAQEMQELARVDDYPSDNFILNAAGYNIAIKSEMIAEAIAALPQDKRNIILLSYFLEMSDKEIAQKLNLVRRTVHFKRTSSLQEIKKRLEGNANE